MYIVIGSLLSADSASSCSATERAIRSLMLPKMEMDLDLNNFSSMKFTDGCFTSCCSSFIGVPQYSVVFPRGRIARAAPLNDGAFRITSQGTFGVHGVERDQAMTCDVSPDGAGYRVQCEFEVLLSDHDIEIPSVMFLKLNNEVQLTLDFYIEPVEGSW